MPHHRTTTDVVVIGAGQAGLALSHQLIHQGIEHVVLERGTVGERWRSERWNSMRMLTPNWMNALPGSRQPAHPDGFVTASEFASYLAWYAQSCAAPVVGGAAVESVSFAGVPGPGARFDVRTAAGTWRARNVVVATGWCDLPAVPEVAHDLHRDVVQMAPRDYRNPDSLPDGAVLVVGASATGVQLAAELRAAGRDVVVAVGRHSRLPRTYRGMDIFWWLQRTGNFDRTIDEVGDARRARTEPSVQLVGRPDRRSVDLRVLQRFGVRMAGRLVAAQGHRVTFADDLMATAADADAQMRRVLSGIDAHIDATGLAAEVNSPEPLPAYVPTTAPTELDLRAEGITSVVWATGHRRTYPWLRVPVLDEWGEIRQRRGITPVPGVYVLGQRFQHHRSSNFVHGVGRDAAFVADHLAARVELGSRH